jgi:hypothetical protein
MTLMNKSSNGRGERLDRLSIANLHGGTTPTDRTSDYGRQGLFSRTSGMPDQTKSMGGAAAM